MGLGLLSASMAARLCLHSSHRISSQCSSSLKFSYCPFIPLFHPLSVSQLLALEPGILFCFTHPPSLIPVVLTFLPLMQFPCCLFMSHSLQWVTVHPFRPLFSSFALISFPFLSKASILFLPSSYLSPVLSSHQASGSRQSAPVSSIFSSR